MEGIEQIFPFENHRQEIGVSLAHPHGQVYCYPFIAPKMEANSSTPKPTTRRPAATCLRIS